MSDEPADLPEVLLEARARLDALAQVPLEQHPAEFTAIDSLLRAALDAPDTPLAAGR